LQQEENYRYDFNRVYEKMPVMASFKQQPEDFIVAEHIAFELTGEGEHCWLYVQKKLLNTDDVALKLAKFAGVKSLAVGYAGLKDKVGVTSQWFSVQLPGLEAPDWSQLESENLQVLHSTRHSRKLQRGALSHNTFTIRLRDVSSLEKNLDAFALLEQRCQQVALSGVPNYFGLQRFGRGLNNLNAAVKMFMPTDDRDKDNRQRDDSREDKDSPNQNKRRKKKKLSRHQRSLYLSSARSWMFNHILSTRIENGSWNTRLAGDVFQLNGKSACFVDDADESLDLRLQQFEINPTGVLWGDGDIMAQSECLLLEQNIIDQFPVFRDGLVDARVDVKRRALRLQPVNLEGQQQEGDFIVSFQLPPGAYATVVLDEIVDIA